MTEKQARRPPVAPKPSFIHQDATTVKISPLPSPALQGATTAFGPGPVKVSNAVSSHNPSTGALLAATAAAGKRQQAQQQAQQQHWQNAPKNGLVAQLQSSGSRGRQPATRNESFAASQSSPSPPKARFQPHSPQSTTSAVAQVAASAATSPVRQPESKEDLTSLYLPGIERLDGMRLRSRSTSSVQSDTVLSAQRSPAALAGAIASMTNAPVQDRGQIEDKQKTDLSGISHLFLSPSHPSTGSSPSPSPSGTAAAAVATRNAAAAAAATAEARRREESVFGESRLSDSFSENVALSPSLAKGSSWPEIKLTPPETNSDTDSESLDDYESAPETPQEPRSAPVPLRRPGRAATVAQENANAHNAEAPILDARTKMTASSLADAMVASSLASQQSASRVASPARNGQPPPPPPKPRRRSRSASLFETGKPHLPFLGRGSETAPQTPKLPPRKQRPMRQTMRSPSPDHREKDDEPAKRGRRHWRRHPNMHHEGDRKRWRDLVTDRERKRYEGVWAANRGLLVDLDLAILEALQEQSQHSQQQQQQQQPQHPAHKNIVNPADLVVNVVVRDIWERSRLPKDVLEEVWDLVAAPGATAVNREEFVIGLWLIDQRLKGRKLPVKVSPSVWQSVRHPQGVRIRNKSMHK
ncbi:hypothetical protein A1O1_09161 [Capronia coronata CBS 617.96]|uniref:EH domain-containing protein n=1 Tax=Capronia coronata CBS 617.96 TaxID=1182541 RepID=W9Y8N1_9EURO|nr:uncharacterized protein A1O1_09161 [Capronia coronata CBS 617.96]EXJ78759.1 hypothetical protein A1O1_09161 [Capronia coronata CBS 617.96]